VVSVMSVCKYFWLLIVLLLCISPFTSQAQVPKVREPSFGQVASVAFRQSRRLHGIVAHWMIFEGGGTKVRNGLGRGIDTNNATLINMNASTSWVVGPFGWALDFDGVDQRLDIDLSDKFVHGTNPRTISLWFNADVFPTDPSDRMFVLSSRGTVDGDQLFIAAEDNGVSVGFTGARLIFDKNNLNTNEWYNFVLVVPVNSDTDGVTGYVNGALTTPIYESGSNQTINTFDNGAEAIGGVGGGTPSSFFNGQLDEIRIYNRALNASEAKSLFTDPFLEFRPVRVAILAAMAAAVGKVKWPANPLPHNPYPSGGTWSAPGWGDTTW